MSEKKKIAVLGGGIGSLSTVFGLTSEPGWRDKYDITVYQQGWRLGGKCASSRNAQVADRIEEHGLHIFFGFYDNAIKMMRTAYAELERPATAPLATFDAAFKPHSFITIEEYIDDEWVHFPIFFPPNEMVPGADENFEQDTLDTPMGTVVWLLQEIKKQLHDHHRQHGHPATRKHPLLEKIVAWFSRVFRKDKSVLGLIGHVEKAIEHVEDKVLDDIEDLENFGVVFIGIIEGAIALLKQLFGPAYGDPQSRRQILLATEFGFYVLKGMIGDKVFRDGWDAIDDIDFRAWLTKHGAPRRVTCSAITRSFYDLYLAYPSGNARDALCGGNVAAGTLLHAYYLSCAQYKGAIFWKMQAGMGESVIIPLYQALQKRGVKFEFFHSVSKLGLSDDKRYIAEIGIDIQATLKPGINAYDPLTEVRGLPCWPNDPVYGLLQQGDELQEHNIDLESPWSPWQPVANKTLHLGEDFDLCVLGISIGALAPITTELAADDANPGWKAMLENVQTSATQAMQLWMKPNLEETGWKMSSVVLDAYADPFNTWADMSQTLDKENWPQNHLPFSIAYFCNNLDDPDPVPPYGDHGYPAREQARVKRNAIDWLNSNTAHLWPYSSNEEGGLKWDQLVDMNDGDGEARFDGQYWHAAINPSERYVLSVAGSSRHRLKTDETGYQNLFITGDWIDNGFLNIGCVESTVVAGFTASRAIGGYPERIFYLDR